MHSSSRYSLSPHSPHIWDISGCSFLHHQLQLTLTSLKSEVWSCRSQISPSAASSRHGQPNSPFPFLQALIPLPFLFLQSAASSRAGPFRILLHAACLPPCTSI